MKAIGGRWLAPAAIVLILIFTACGDKSAVGPDTNDDDPLLTCAELAFTNTAGTTLDEISIGKIPGDFEDPVYAAVLTGDSDPAYTFVFVDESQNTRLIVPLHPVTPLTGGEVSIIVTDGTRACDPVTFNIQPLPEAPGEFNNVVDGLQEILRQQLEVFGTTPEEIISTPVNDLPVILHPAALIQSVIDHPENEFSLRDLASGEREVLNGEGLDLGERLLARINLSESLGQTAGKSRKFADYTLGNDEIEQCTPEIIGDDAFRLDSCMKLAFEAKIRAEGAQGEILNDLNMMFGIASLAPNPLVEILSNVLGAMSWAIQNQRERTAALLPSYLSELIFIFSHVEFLEDDDSIGDWSADLVAENTGWDLGKEMIEFALQAANTLRAIEKLGKADSINDLIVYIGSGPVAQALIGDGTLDEFVVNRQEFGPVDITSEDWSVADIVTGTSIELFSHNSYRPFEPGISRISIKTRDGKFGGNQIADFQDISVKQILVNISPDEVRSEPQEYFEFIARVQNSKYPELLEIDPSINLQGVAELFYGGDGVYQVAYEAPEFPDYSIPDKLRLKHTATTGARENGTDRFDETLIRFASLEILSNTTCAQPGQEVQFSKVILGLENEEVIWSASLGNDPVDGLYTVPQAATGTEVTIRAESVEDADLFDETTITIGCVCSFTLQVGDNPTYTGKPGDVASYTSYGGAIPGEPYAIASMSFSNPDEEVSAYFSVEIPTTVMNGPGEYPVSKATGSLGYGGAGDQYDNTKKDSGTIRIFEYEPHTKLIGELSGTTREWENKDSPPIPYSASFQIYPPPGSLGWTYRCEIIVQSEE